MALTDTQLETLSRDLLIIARCARTLHAQLQPGHNAGDGVWHRPVYGPRPPCSITVLDLLHEADQVLAGWLGNLAADYLGETVDGADETPRAWAARRDRTTHAKANRLWEQRHLLASREYATDAADEIAQQARTLADRAEPPPPTKPPTIPREEVFATAGELAPVVSDITGRTITRKQITYWGDAGHITRFSDTTGQSKYRLAEVLDHAGKE
ncbi:hypothetical protein [Corynebacterium freneyi]|uniref:Helix-turn-helix DNA binding domain protein n=1 Tax=Corynebacterium freneyi TaxID=134034 RepID=A0ABS4U9U8_9CORY|nr:hypothetical protein [Corynebacterium freneyi]MBP2333305.1 hypothetical protein [Corynebacterium freneyi]QXA52643.1 hypothetical protein I6L56_11455 [Corynebacterium freneyi]WJZ04591.1 hypothetical protein CFREN_03025 [Corynebacterium freneyi]